jgi:hypothetical protein
MALGIALMATSSIAQAGVCQTIKNKMDQIFQAPTADACLGLKVNPTVDELLGELKEKGLLYIDLNVTEDCFGQLKAPGLPDFGFGGGGFDACKMISAVTGAAAREANKALQDGVNKGVNAVDSKAQEYIGTELTDFQMSEILKAQAAKQNITIPPALSQ